jgi:hypothetical protein
VHPATTFPAAGVLDHIQDKLNYEKLAIEKHVFPKVVKSKFTTFSP